MKKVLSVLLVMVMAISSLPVFAQTATEDVLLKVKEKVSVPEELTEFNYSENKYEDILRYDFNWRNEDYSKELYVSTDSRGRIVTYSYYEQVDYNAAKTLISYTLADAKPLAEETVKKMFPEYFEKEVKKLVLNEKKITSSYSGRYKTFSFIFDRVFQDVNVESNRVVVRIRATKDKMYVQSVNASLDEDVLFVTEEHNAVEESNAMEKYEEKFPIRLYYATDYSSDEPTVKLFYSMDKGYIALSNGEIITEEYFDRYAGVTEDSAESMGGVLMNKNEAVLTPEEKGEIEKMESLVKVHEVEKLLRGLSILKITEDMKFDESYTYKADEKYFVRFTLESEDRRMNVTYNGETGEVVNISSYFIKGNKVEEEVKEFTIPEERIKAFSKALSASKLDETKIEFAKFESRATMNAERIVNSIPFPENSINVTYDAQNEMVTRYSVSWLDDVSAFPNPDEAIGLDKAREILFKDGINFVWLKQKENYVEAITIENYVTINAVSGEKMYQNTEEKVSYTDIDSHWAMDIINILWEHDIYVPGDKFTPDAAINQADMIRLFSACRDSGIIPVWWKDKEIANYAFEEGFVEVAEPEKLIKRREGFKALIEVLGYGSIADFDIYKSSYSDLQADGSAEILKAMGVLQGDVARADDNLTYAEAAVMVYRYLSK